MVGSPSLPPLAEFLRWLDEMPESFRAEPAGLPAGTGPARDSNSLVHPGGEQHLPE